ncbi:MOSC domain-containing protein [Prosthecomicrobium sp. N25]|uniref:MOSC domain-containing protein n=1 Tax=Prosthecomicrobium sp. N25 TaxID=3129254 RepID=UPI0030783678
MEARIAAIYRYPVKGFSPERLPAADLEPGRTIAWDRAFAIENGPSGFDPAAPAYFPKIRFLMLMRNAEVAKLKTRFDPASMTLTVEEAGAPALTARLDRQDGRAALEAFVAARFPGELRGPPRLLATPGHSFSDVAAKVLHLVNLESLRDLERHVGAPVDPLRFRANLYVEGIPAWSEFGLVDRTAAAGSVRLEGVKRTERCAATNVDPATGLRDLQIPRTLMGAYGHTDCGIYVRVTAGGRLAEGDRLALDLAAETLDLPF